MRILLFAHRFGGQLIFRILLVPVICFYVIVRRQSQSASTDYLSRMHRFTGTFPAPRIWHVFLHFWNFAGALLDKLSVWSGEITLDDIVIHGRQTMDDLVAAKHGGLLLISHLGNFEICQALSEKIPDFRLTVLHHTRHATKFNQLLNQYKNASSIALLQVTDLDMGVAMQLSERVTSGEFLAMSADRIAIDNPGSAVTASFLGAPAPFPSGPFILGLTLQAPIVTAFCIKEAGRYNVYFETLWEGGEVRRRERTDVISGLMHAYVKRLEYYCQRAPLQWYNFYSFWHPEQGQPAQIESLK
jgi:predicted LPLAT superfamily acyltransferase